MFVATNWGLLTLVGLLFYLAFIVGRSLKLSGFGTDMLFNKLYAEIAAPVLVGDPKPDMSDDEERRIINILNSLRYSNSKLNAIKLIRGTYGFGLKEAKDIADHLCNYLSKAGYSVAEYPDPAWLNSSQQRVLDKLIWIEKHH